MDIGSSTWIQAEVLLDQCGSGVDSLLLNVA